MKFKSSILGCRFYIIFLSIVLFLSSNIVGRENSNSTIINIDENRYKVELIHHDNFETQTENWVVEQMPGGEVDLMNGKLDIRDKQGCTVWYKKKLKGPILIEYEVTMIDSGAANERSSDLNCFWMAQDPDNPDNLFKNSDKRGGNFPNYHSLRTYYVGYGGHYNTRTRFRRYKGDGTRPLLPEHDLKKKKYMNIPNQTRKVQLIANGKHIRYIMDGEKIFSYTDDNPYTSGWFGFRTVKNHMKVEYFKVYKIINKLTE